MKTFYRASSWRVVTIIVGFTLSYIYTNSLEASSAFVTLDAGVRYLGQLLHDTMFDKIF